MNVALLNTMIEGYNRFSFSHNYIFGFADRGNVYMCEADSTVLPYVLTLNSDGRGGGYALRFKPNRAQKELLKHRSEILCSESYFNSLVANGKYNAGEIFEKLVHDYFGVKWHKDNIPFTVDGDIWLNATPYQIKFFKGTFITEKQLVKLSRGC